MVKFGRSKSKEVFAYLIDRNGATVTNGEICAILWNDEEASPEKRRNYFHHIYSDLRNTLERIGCEDILVKEHNTYAISPEKIPCDYYLALQKDAQGIDSFHGEYMSQYSWSEMRLGNIMGRLEEGE